MRPRSDLEVAVLSYIQQMRDNDRTGFVDLSTKL
jgi:hypothetical protein